MAGLDINNLDRDEKQSFISFLCYPWLLEKSQVLEIVGAEYENVVLKALKNARAQIKAAKQVCDSVYAHQLWLFAEMNLRWSRSDIYADFLWKYLGLGNLEQFAAGICCADYHDTRCVNIPDRDIPYAKFLEAVRTDVKILSSIDDVFFDEDCGKEFILFYLERCKQYESVVTMPRNENELKNSLAQQKYWRRLHWSKEHPALIDQILDTHLSKERAKLLKLRFGLGGESVHLVKDLCFIEGVSASTVSNHIQLAKRQVFFLLEDLVFENEKPNDSDPSILSSEPLRRRICDLNFSERIGVRAVGALYLNNIFTVGDLVQKTEEELLNIPNFGVALLGVVKQTLAQYNLSLGMIIEDLESSMAQE